MDVSLSLSPPLYSLLSSIGEEHLADVFGVATISIEKKVITSEETEEDIQNETTDVYFHHEHYISKVAVTHAPKEQVAKKHLVKISATKAKGGKCERCWRYIALDSSPLCLRCQHVMETLNTTQ